MSATERVSRTAWVVYIAGVLAYVVAVVHRTAFGVASAEAAQRFDIEATTLALFAVVQIGFYAAMQVPAGTMLDRFGAGRVIAVGSVVMAAGQLLLAFAPSVQIALAARALLGAGDAPVFIGVARLVAQHFPARRVPVMVQVTGLVGQTGQLLSAIPVAAYLHYAGWSPAFAGLAALGLVTAVGAFGVLAPRSRQASFGGGASEASAPLDGDERPRLLAVIATHWKTPGVRLGFWSHFLGPISANTLALIWGFPFFTNGQGLSTTEASLLLTCMVVANIAVAPFIGIATARHPLRRSWLVLGGGMVQVIAWIALLVPGGARPLWQLVVFVCVIGAGGPMSLVGMDFARSFAAERLAGSANGFVNMGGFAATILGVLLVGVVLQVASPAGAIEYSLDAYRLAFAALAVPWALGVLGVVLARRRTRALMASHGIVVPPLRQALRRGRN